MTTFADLTAQVRQQLMGFTKDQVSLTYLTQPMTASSTTFTVDTETVTALSRGLVEIDDEMILVKDIEVASTCEHHLVPFYGYAHVAYIPGRDGRITGLSKLARLVDVFAKRPQVQERLTTQIAEALCRLLEPAGVMVVIEAEHLCMTMRGVRKPGAKTLTSAVRGQLRNPATRAEAVSLILGH